jgi:hypothetical protein
MALTECPNCWMVDCTCTSSSNYHQPNVMPYRQEYEKLRTICSRIYYARIAGCEKTVIECLKDIDNYFREPNMN